MIANSFVRIQQRVAKRFENGMLDEVKMLQTQLIDFFSTLESRVDIAIKSHKANLQVFFAGLAPAIKFARRAQAAVDRVAATRFSVFPYFNAEERDISRIFGDLLDPSGSHGQGDHFLRLFLEGLEALHLDGPPADLTECVVYLEFPTTSIDAPRWIDIVLHVRNGLWIGIENKPWAADQDRQIEDYLRDLRLKADAENGIAWMLYCSGSGKKPTEWPQLTPDDKARCLTVPYKSVHGSSLSIEQWIELCAENCQAERVRWFLRDFLAFIRCNFEIRTQRMAEHEEIES